MKLGYATIAFFFLGCAAVPELREEKGSTSSHLEGGQLLPAQIAHAARAAGVPCGDKLVTAVAVGLGESDGVLDAKHYNGDGSVDRGVWQINSSAWPMYSEACVFDAACNAGAMVDISGSGSNWQPWVAFTNGRYQMFLDDARAGVATECNGGGEAVATPVAAGSSATCDALGYYGKCVGQTSIWSEPDGRCRVRDCASEGKECGLISDEVGLGCKGGTAGAKVSDCSAFGPEGRCVGGTKVWAAQGQCRWTAMAAECFGQK